ncbi:winged helix-turn-helix domain-containing protein [uncultured Methanolobus sp.]|uniref:winged helix-turn-helix domain-containing protein n=1 Tax=uncultured Methanolobus sp. TaxID=218300 RepID=UPI002AABEAD0|nr:winged helix-turn-helix domain-containing protein [uncultured Methanolobus sp.]
MVVSDRIKLKILQALSAKDMHIAELSKELHVSGTCVSKNVRILENANLVNRNVLGRSHVISLVNKEEKNNVEKELSDLDLYIIEHQFLV